MMEEKSALLVSIIIPSYNYGHFISETLNCLKQQHYSNWEAIVVDDGSTDNTAAVVQQFAEADARIKYFFQENKGLPAARNTGISYAEGKYIQFLDADDLVSEHKLTIQVAFMEAHPNLSVSYTAARFFESGNQNIHFKNIYLNDKEWMPVINASGVELLKKLILNNIMPVNAALISSSALQKTGKQNEQLKSLEDWEYWIRCALDGASFAYVADPEALALIRVHASSMSQNKKAMYQWEISIRESIAQWINNSDLPIEEKQTLTRINKKGNIKAYSRLMANQPFSIEFTGSLFSRFGFISAIKVILKYWNNNRKQ
ncbi:MAG: glycosyltransferase [Pedobacter sp.]|nr:MAG: glycosyltransferase [Pedobacter sp.]